MIKILAIFIVTITTVSAANAVFTESGARENAKYTSSLTPLASIAGMVTNLNRDELQTLIGRHLTLKERILFTLYKLKARHKQKPEQTHGFNVDGFLIGFADTALGAFLGLLGLFAFGIIGLLLVIGTFIFSKDKNYQK